MDEWNKKKLKLCAICLIPFYTFLAILCLIDKFVPLFTLPTLIIGQTLWGLFLLFLYKTKGKKYFEV